MYPKNTASPRPLYAAVVAAADGSGITSGVAAYHIQGTTRGAGGGTLAHVAGGKWYYLPTQAETDYDSFAIEFYHADAVAGGPVVNVVTSAHVPQTGDSFVIVNGDHGNVSIQDDVDELLARLTTARAGALTDWIDGGRLDLLLDAIKAKTDLGLLNTTWTDAKAGYLDEAISAAKTLTSGERTTLAAAIEAAIINELDGTAVMQAIADLIAADMTTGDLSVVAIATATRDAILNRVLAGNHDTASTVGLLLQYLDATITSRHASGAAVAKSPATLDWSADVSNKPTIGTSTFNPATDTVANVTTVATLTNAPADMATATNQTTMLNRLGAFTGSGVNTVLGFFKALLSKTATLPTDVGGTFDPATDSTEAIRDRGDAAWITAAGTSTITTTDIENIVIETGVTLKQALQRVGAVAAGKVSGAGTGTEVFVGMDGSTTRVTVTVDDDGNRSAITYDA